MQRFYFDMEMADQLIEDREGIAFENLDIAAREARISLLEMAYLAARAGELLDVIGLKIRDEQRSLLLELNPRDALEAIVQRDIDQTGNIVRLRG